MLVLPWAIVAKKQSWSTILANQPDIALESEKPFLVVCSCLIPWIIIVKDDDSCGMLDFGIRRDLDKSASVIYAAKR